MAKELTRRHIYKETYDEVYLWAIEKHRLEPRSIRMMNNFPIALQEYIKHLKGQR